MDQTLKTSSHALASGLPLLPFGCRTGGERTWSSPEWSGYTGLSGAESAGLLWLHALHPDDRQATLGAWDAAAGGYIAFHRIRCREDNEYRWHQTRAAPVREAGSTTGEWVGASMDVDDIYRSARAEQHLRTLVDGGPQLLWRSSNMGHWTWANAQWLEFTGQTQQQSHHRGWLDAVHPEDRNGALAAWEEARPHGQLDVEFRVRRAADGAYVWHRTRSNPVRDPSGRIVEWLGSTTDVQDLKALQERQRQLVAKLAEHARALEAEAAQRRRSQAKLLHDAQHDALTGLYNRAFFMERLGTSLDGEGGRCAVLMLDLDRFKLVNDSLGHQVGDLLLREVATRLLTCIRADDTLARFGGDEFALLIDAAGGPEAAEDAAARIVDAMQHPLWLGDQEVVSTCSVGVVHPAGYPSPDLMLRDADLAMYHAKRAGKACYAVFNAAMHDSAADALRLRTDLRNALPRGEMQVAYQPICLAATGRIVGVEALVRWIRGTHGEVPPAKFIPLAEETGLIRDIGRWVLHAACAQFAVWRGRFPALDLRLNVNISGEQLKADGFMNALAQTLAQTGLDAASLQLEVTESVFLHQPELIGALLERIRGLGVGVALDDFGTGYSSLAYLCRFQLDGIKIDRSFVAGIPDQARNLAIVQTVMRLGDALGLDVVAEGVEEASELRALQEAGCKLVQGYLTGRPITAPEMTGLLSRQLG